MNKTQGVEIYKRMHFIRNFEYAVQVAHKSGFIYVPIYLSVGQESIAATLSVFFEGMTIPIFAQHRAHSYFLAFGGSPDKLKNSLISKEDSWDLGAAGSASISDANIKMFGHSGFMGDQVPIAAGYALVNEYPAISVVGDASAEEDYVLATLGFIANRDIPLLLVCEDNNFSILTPKSVRRNWNLKEVSKSFGCESHDINDSPTEIWSILQTWDMQSSLVLNINTTRHLWHAGSGQDATPTNDTLVNFKEYLKKTFIDVNLEEIESVNEVLVKEIWNDAV